jgi:hypothetical protein
MKNQNLKNLVKKSNLSKINEDFVILNNESVGVLRGGDNVGCPKKPGDGPTNGLCDVVINGYCPVSNSGCGGGKLTLELS